MHEQTVEVLSRRAAASMSRRGSLLSLGGALVAAISAPSLAQAKKNTKKGKKKAKRKAAERIENQANLVCQSQVAGCRAQILAVCNAPGSVCAAVANCCSSLGTCNATEFFTCLVTVAG
jgi:hypothetical protein